MVDRTGDAVDLGGEKKDDSPGKQEQGQENLPPVLGKQEQAPIEEVADVPDPDEDDLDDLDGMCPLKSLSWLGELTTYSQICSTSSQL